MPCKFDAIGEMRDECRSNTPHNMEHEKTVNMLIILNYTIWK